MTKPRYSKSAIPGFPEIIQFEFRCRTCRLTQDEPGIARVVHDLWAAQHNLAARDPAKLSERQTAEKAALLLERHGVREVDRRSMERHFASHVNFEEATLGVAEKFRMPKEDELTPYLDEDEAALLDISDDKGPEGQNGNDYQKMYQQFRRMERRLQALDADPTFLMTKEGTFNAMNFATFVKGMQEARQTLEGLNKMRNQDRVVLAILEGHTKRFVMAASASVQDEIREILATLRAEAPHKSRALWTQDEYDAYFEAVDRAISALNAFVQERTPRIFISSAEDTLDQSRAEFNLH